MSLMYSLMATALVSLVSFVGVFMLSLREKTLDRVLFVLVSFAAGSILGAAFLDLLPEAIAETLGAGAEISTMFLYIIGGFLVFFFLERFIYWYHGHIHGHEQEHEVDPRAGSKKFVYLNLLGDGIHNFIDGMVIAASFFIDVSLGFTITLSAIFHEIPQEIGDFGVLVYGGLTRMRGLLFNFVSALTAILGALLTNFYFSGTQNFTHLLISFAAGGFIYIGASELVPELQKEKDFKRSLVQLVLFIAGIALIWTLGHIFPE